MIPRTADSQNRHARALLADDQQDVPIALSLLQKWTKNG
jgi:hypothetical protein